MQEINIADPPKTRDYMCIHFKQDGSTTLHFWTGDQVKDHIKQHGQKNLIVIATECTMKYKFYKQQDEEVDIEMFSNEPDIP